MQIELIGCTSAGKSTLAQELLQDCQEQGIDIWMGDDFVLRQIHLSWVKGHLLRTILVDLCSLFACLATWRRHREFYQFTLNVTWRLPVSISWMEKLNIIRNTLKKIGIYEIVQRHSSDQSAVVMDEGTLHTAHYLFVHVSVEPNPEELSTFIQLIPIPDMVIYVTQSETELISRTMKRGHNRIPDRSYVSTERFVKRAVETFEKLAQSSVPQEKLLVVEGA